jgi:hypothetical protein
MRIRKFCPELSNQSLFSGLFDIKNASFVYGKQSVFYKKNPKNPNPPHFYCDLYPFKSGPCLLCLLDGHFCFLHIQQHPGQCCFICLSFQHCFFVFEVFFCQFHFSIIFLVQCFIIIFEGSFKILYSLLFSLFIFKGLFFQFSFHLLLFLCLGSKRSIFSLLSKQIT